jgi:hypothetical protein
MTVYTCEVCGKQRDLARDGGLVATFTPDDGGPDVVTGICHKKRKCRSALKQRVEQAFAESDEIEATFTDGSRLTVDMKEIES